MLDFWTIRSLLCFFILCDIIFFFSSLVLIVITRLFFVINRIENENRVSFLPRIYILFMDRTSLFLFFLSIEIFFNAFKDVKNFIRKSRFRCIDVEFEILILLSPSIRDSSHILLKTTSIFTRSFQMIHNMEIFFFFS